MQKPRADEPTDRCPRCGGGFCCGINGSVPCPCSTLAVGADTLASLRQRYDGCLCMACLAELAADG